MPVCSWTCGSPTFHTTWYRSCLRDVPETAARRWYRATPGWRLWAETSEHDVIGPLDPAAGQPAAAAGAAGRAARAATAAMIATMERRTERMLNSSSAAAVRRTSLGGITARHPRGARSPRWGV